MSILDHAPAFSLDDASGICRSVYGLRATASALPSERDQNFLLRTGAGDRFVLKFANATEELALLEAQNQAMERLAKRVDFCPQVVPDLEGNQIATFTSATGVKHFVRLVTYLPGRPLGNLKFQSDALFRDLGVKIGQLSGALQDFDHPALHRDFHWDLASGLETIRAYQGLIRDPEIKKLVAQFTVKFEQDLTPLMPTLRKSIIHNDANDFNLLVDGGNDIYTHNQTITGLIDFGDMLYSYTAGDLAVAAAYAMLGKDDPLACAARIAGGFHSDHPLEENELAALYNLVCLRLCMSACLAAYQQTQQPDNAYLSISQAAIHETLPVLAGIHPRFAEAVFREACDLPACPKDKAVAAWLKSKTGEFSSPLSVDLRNDSVAVLDLSVSSPLISGDPAQNEESHLTPRINDAIREAGVQVALGRYDEARYFYTSPAFGSGDRPTSEFRTVHLGLDLFAPEGTPVHAVLGGTIHAFADNKNPQDYGPIVMLEHPSPDHPTFYTLYGHLSRDSLKGLNEGEIIQNGERLGAIGSAKENGGWTPHLHLQIVIDPLDLGTDFPGVARPSQRDVWKSLCPDPNLLLGIPDQFFPAPVPEITETIGARRKRLGHNLSLSYRQPLKIVRGWKQYLFDYQGRKFLDAYNNVAHVGHNHPRVVAAAKRQIELLNTNTRYLHDNINHFAEKLTSLLPEPLRVCYFVNSGSEANELALRLARTYTGKRDLIVLDAAYHGVTTTLIDISPYKHNGPGGTGTPDWVHIAPIPDDYRGAYKRDDPLAGEKYAGHVGEIIEGLKRKGVGVAGYIAESLPSVGGQIVFPPGYLKDVYRRVREAGGVCIADEVQTGLGRIGTHMWGFELQSVIPDIVVLGKPLGNGHPLAAVITTPEIAESFDNGMEFFSTFGGNPVSCAVGLEVLQVVLDEKLQQHAHQVGEVLLAGLRPLSDRYPIVGDVRGAGLFLGVELVRDRQTLEPATDEAGFVADRMREYGILLGTDGPYHNVIKIRPPMPFDMENARFLVSTFVNILEQELDYIQEANYE
jgi:4-aminobutyrate aminotransferase-like enzyme/Ser/Thr protein kinase RdoA (MazF antagonist)